MKLQNLQVGQSYLVKDCLTQDDIRKHLAHLGLKVGEEIRIISKTKTNAIFQVKASRLALDREIIESLVLTEKSATEIINLSEAPIGSSAKVMDIYATGHSVVASWIWDLQRTRSYFSKKSLPWAIQSKLP